MENNYTLVKGAYNSHFQYYSQALQDKFIAHLFDFKKNGFVVDIGSSGDSSNSYFFDQFLDWKCICVDMLDGDYARRKNTTFYKGNAIGLDYEDMFKANKFPKVIDYVSIDIDKETNSVMKALPYEKHQFSVITIEHDAYAEGDNRKAEQRKFLTDNGFHLLCSDVCFLNPLSPMANMYFEDWWINPQTIPVEKYKFLECDKTDVNDIIAKFNK